MVFTSVYTFNKSTFFRERHKKHNNMTVALHQLFESHKDELSLKLKGLRLPSDENQLFRIVYDYLNSVFDSNGDFRQSLTLSEDYILQAAISLLNAQRDMAESIKNVETNNPLFNEPKIETNESSIQSKEDKTVFGNETLSFYASVLSTNNNNLMVSLILPDVMSCNDESISDTIPLTYNVIPGSSVNGNESERILTLESGTSAIRYSGKIDMTIGDTSNISQGEYSAILTIIVSSI